MTADGVIPVAACEWRIGPPATLETSEVRIVERAQRDGTVLYAVVMRGWVANRDREWEIEPIPSSRDDAFETRTRLTRWDDAAHLAQHMARAPRPVAAPCGGGLTGPAHDRPGGVPVTPDLTLPEVVHIARCPEHGLHGDRTECFVCGGPVDQVALIPAGASPASHGQWYSEPMAVAMVIDWLRSRHDPRVADLDSALELLHRPWALTDDHEQMHDEIRARREIDPC